MDKDLISYPNYKNKKIVEGVRRTEKMVFIQKKKLALSFLINVKRKVNYDL